MQSFYPPALKQRLALGLLLLCVIAAHLVGVLGLSSRLWPSQLDPTLPVRISLNAGSTTAPGPDSATAETAAPQASNSHAQKTNAQPATATTTGLQAVTLAVPERENTGINDEPTELPKVEAAPTATAAESEPAKEAAPNPIAPPAPPPLAATTPEPPAAPPAPASPSAPTSAPTPTPAPSPTPALANNEPAVSTTPPPPAAPAKDALPNNNAESSAPVTVPTPSTAAEASKPVNDPPAWLNNAHFIWPTSTRLIYEVIGESKGLRVNADGDMLWKFAGNQYEMRLEIRHFLLGSKTQTSVGQLSPQGLQPKRFGDKYKQEVAAHFDREKNQLVFSASSNPQPLLQGAQDRLSLFVQLAAVLAGTPELRQSGQQIGFQVAAAKSADNWTFQVEKQEVIQLPAGKFNTWKLSRVFKGTYDQTADMWLSPAHGYLPIKVRIAQSNGDVLEQNLSKVQAP